MSMTGLLPSWELALESDNKSPKTIKSYLASVRSLAAFLAANNMPGEVDDVTTESIRAFLVAERERTTPAHAQQHYRNLSVWWNWLVTENERAGDNPMARVTKPEVPVKMKPFFTEDDLARLLRGKLLALPKIYSWGHRSTRSRVDCLSCSWRKLALRCTLRLHEVQARMAERTCRAGIFVLYVGALCLTVWMTNPDRRQGRRGRS